MSDTILTPSHRTAGPAPTPPAVPDHELLRRIGQGAYGEVWLARNVMGTWRAVKVVYRRTFQEDRPFEREFEGIRKFEPISRSQPSQVNILHVGRNEAEGYFYYVMELGDDQARGQEIDPASYAPRTLKSELLFRGHLPAAECVRLALDLTTALEHLHQHGLVHRDIKPANIIFVNGQPKLADIGLVAQAEATMSFVGTEGYVPPEGPGTVQADLYSLGKVLYEIATGRDRQEFPELPTRLGASPAEEAELLELNEVFLKACDHEVKRRYASAQEMHADLALLQAGESVARLRNTERRLRFVQRAGALVTAIAALAAGLYLWQARQTHIVQGLVAEKTTLAEDKTRLASEKSALADENRQRVIRLDVANGVQLLDQGDPSAALLWFADALRLATNHPAEESIHRIRFQQTLDVTPRLVQAMGYTSYMGCAAISPDNRHVVAVGNHEWGATSGENRVCLWDVRSGQPVWTNSIPERYALRLRFDRDGKRVFVSSFGLPTGNRQFEDWRPNLAWTAVIDARTGHAVFPPVEADHVTSAFSPDDRWLAIAHTNNVIELLDTRDGSRVASLIGHTNKVIALGFSPDSARLASGSRDHTVRLWQVAEGKPVGQPLRHDHSPALVAWSPDGQRLAAGTSTNIVLWRLAPSSEVETVFNEDSTELLFFSPTDPLRLFSATGTSSLHVWDLRTNAAPMTKLRPGGQLRAWAFSPEGSMLALGTFGGEISLWDTKTWQPLPSGLRHSGFVDSIQFSPDGTHLVSADYGGVVKVWSLGQKSEDARLALPADHRSAEPHEFRPRTHGPGPLSLFPKDGKLHLIDPDKLIEVGTLAAQQPKGRLSDWAEGATGKYWATTESIQGGSGGRTFLWRREAGSFRAQELPLLQRPRQFQFNSDDSRLLTLSRDHPVTVSFWRTSDGGLDRTVTLPEAMSIAPAGLDSQGRYLLLWWEKDLPGIEKVPRSPSLYEKLYGPAGDGGSTDRRANSVQLFDLNQGRLVGAPFWPFRICHGLGVLRFSPNGQRLATVGEEDGSGAIVDLFTGRLAAPKFKHGGNLKDVHWSPNGRFVLTAGTFPSVKIWDAASGELYRSPMHTGTNATMSARWSADGRFIATRNSDGSVRVWDAATTEAITPLLPHSEYVRWVHITPGNRLITGSDPNLLRAWDLKPTALSVDVLSDYAKFLAGRRLTAAGALVGLPAGEMADLAKSLRARAPQLFQ
jgi:WD40 repeat protein